MDYSLIGLHEDALNVIIDAAIPNKIQNRAVKAQIHQEISVLMNRIAEGWLEQKSPDSDAAQIKTMVDRFLGWKLPENFNPDGGIRFEKIRKESTVRNEPTGTNLLDATQAEEMIRYLLYGPPPPSAPSL